MLFYDAKDRKTYAGWIKADMLLHESGLEGILGFMWRVGKNR
jgi:hypothetical protein